MEYTSIGSLYHEPKGFYLERASTGSQYIFLHFLTPVSAVLKGQDISIRPGGCVFIPPHTRQQFSSPRYELIHDWFHADLSCGDFMKEYGIEDETVYYPANDDEISQLIHQIELEKFNQNAYSRQSIDLFTRRLFILLSRSGTHRPSGAPVSSGQKNQFLKLRLTIQSDLSRSWTVEEMARLVRVSPSRFHYLYKRFFGITPMEDLIQKRIQYAQWLIMNDDYSVTRVAELCGYHNEYHFIRQFKKLTGITPGKYRAHFL